MYRIELLVALMLMLIGVEAHAQTCPAGTTRETGTAGDFIAFITGKTICAARGTDRWQEYHSTGVGGDLIDFKLGASHPVDPTKKVGTWSATNGADATVTHNYGPGQSYTWALCAVTAAPGTYTMVSPTAGTVSNVTLLNSQGQCPP